MSRDVTVDDMFPSKYLKAADLPRAGKTLEIDSVEQEKVGDDTKWILYFVGEDRGLILNKTNAKMIASEYGNKVAEWSTRKVHLRREKVSFKGDVVDAIRVSAVEFDDAIPFGKDGDSEAA
ncbi:MAG TPA: hypothetical protein VF329_04245 [Gammaproteobacteria bacterium]